MGTAIKHPVPDRVKPAFVIVDIRALWRSALSVRVLGCQQLQINPVRHRMFYSCTHMTTMGVNGQGVNIAGDWTSFYRRACRTWWTAGRKVINRVQDQTPARRAWVSVDSAWKMSRDSKTTSKTLSVVASHSAIQRYYYAVAIVATALL